MVIDSRHTETAPTKPLLRGWFHAGAFPPAIIGGLALVCLAPTLASRFACAIFTLTAGLLFATSAFYHRGHWSNRAYAVLRRWDHANIFLITAGTYTPLAVLLLPDDQRRMLLTIIWAAAFVGVLFRVFWVGAPRWLYVPVYVGMGVAGIGYIGAFWHASAPAAILILAGGVGYIAGAVVYGLKKPDFFPRHFGFHELFHALTIAGFVCHYLAIMVALFAPEARL